VVEVDANRALVDSGDQLIFAPPKLVDTQFFDLRHTEQPVITLKFFAIEVQRLRCGQRSQYRPRRKKLFCELPGLDAGDLFEAFENVRIALR